MVMNKITQRIGVVPLSLSILFILIVSGTLWNSVTAGTESARLRRVATNASVADVSAIL